MPRKKRSYERGGCYHITHRCHGRQYLFRFAKYRDFYVRQLFQGVRRYGLDVLDYIVTSNHVHLLVYAHDGPEISETLRYVHGRIGQWHNGQRGRTGAFWGDRYHPTRIQSGEHLGRCLVYIDLNMVRAGVVGQPSEWKHSAWSELTGVRQRYRIINMDRLLKCLWIRDEEAFHHWHRQAIEQKLQCDKLERERYWSTAVAVGDPEWLAAHVAAKKLKRHRIIETDNAHYLQGTGGHAVKNVKSKISS